MKSAGMNMCEGPILKKMVIYAIPIMLTQVFQLLFNAADLVVVGRFCGSISVGAIGATGSLTTLLVNLFIGLSVGASVVVAQNLGADNRQGVFRAVHTAIPLATICGVFLTIVGIVFSSSLLRIMGTPDKVLPLSSLYMKIYFCGMIPSLVYNFGAAILRAAGDSKGPLIYLTIAGVVNVLLNLFFVLVLDMNVAGVALATAISQLLSMVLVLIALMRRTDACRLDWKCLHLYKTSIFEICRIGLPAGVQSSLFAASNVLIQSSINSFGDVVMAGNAAAGNIEGITYTAMNAIYQATLSFVGQNTGAKKYDRVNRSLGAGLFLVIVVGLVTGGLTRMLGRPLLSIYITDSPQAIEYGIIRMNYVALFYLFCGMMDVTTGALRGLGRSFIPMVISLLGSCVFRIVWIFTVFAAHRTLETLYLCYPISWPITFMAQMTAYIIVMKKIQKQN
ncbi:MAG: MATE family efflux transporter [Ruminococcaceae bacterium]|nr:MATE family efflux transporter [Oscillospiraceae bacterium]